MKRYIDSFGPFDVCSDSKLVSMNVLMSTTYRSPSYIPNGKLNKYYVLDGDIDMLFFSSGLLYFTRFDTSYYQPFGLTCKFRT